MKNRYPVISRYTCILAFLLLALWGGTTSCVSPKSIIYFQGDTLKQTSQKITQNYIPTIQTGDLLSVVVGSLNAEANEIFNTANSINTAVTNYSATSSGARLQPLGYLVDKDGNIELPMVGKVQIGGLNISDATELIKQKLTHYLKEPSVIVRNLNFKVSVLGEVAKPAVYVIPDEKISLPEVLSLAGDLTIYGQRNNVLVIREEDGNRIYTRIDLTSREIFDSPYYYLHKNDIIYVEPIKTKLAATDRRQQLVPIVTSIVAAVSTIGILILNLTK
jgi:polysaccharide export outer membrane protein